MVDYLDPQENPQQGVNGGGLADQWRGFLAEPSNRAFLIQAGLQLMQPVPVGQTGVGHAAGAVGAGGEAAGRVQHGEEARREQESVQAARAAGSEAKLQTAEAATMRAGAAQQNADTRMMLQRNLLAGGGLTANAIQAARAKAQNEFTKWAGDPLREGPGDPHFSIIQENYPDIKTKADVIRKQQSDPAFQQFLELLFGGPSMPQPGRLQPRPGAMAPPAGIPPNARQGQDGNWYIPNDPSYPDYDPRKPYRMIRQQ